MKKSGFIFLLVLFSCHQKTDINFDYEFMESDSGILIKNYRPVTRDQFTKYLTKVNDTLKLKTLNVMINGHNMQEINHDFKRHFFQGEVGRMELSYVNNDTAKVMERLNFVFGTFNNTTFVKNDNWDSLLLNNRFFKNSY